MDHTATSDILDDEGLRQACTHVWRDSNSIVMLGSDVLNSEPVSYDDEAALRALKRHIAAAGPRAYIDDVLPKLGFGPPPAPQEVHEPPARLPNIICERCGADAELVHLGCSLCLECCDCRPLGT